jgi:hypothetical protein
MSPRARLVLGIVSASSGAVLCSIGAGIFAHQVLTWLRTQHWDSVRLLDLVESPGFSSKLPDRVLQWFWKPQSWHGLHDALLTFLDLAPAGLFFVAIGVPLVWLGLRSENR